MDSPFNRVKSIFRRKNVKSSQGFSPLCWRHSTTRHSKELMTSRSCSMGSPCRHDHSMVHGPGIMRICSWSVWCVTKELHTIWIRQPTHQDSVRKSGMCCILFDKLACGAFCFTTKCGLQRIFFHGFQTRDEVTCNIKAKMHVHSDVKTSNKATISWTRDRNKYK